MSLRGTAVSPTAAESLERDLRERLGERVVVMGVGNPDRADDGAGLRVAELLAKALPGGVMPGGRRLTVLLTEDVPESFLGPAAAARPDTVLLVDAADMGTAPGSVALLEPGDLTCGATFTHRTPLSLLATFLSRETGADVFLLAIQPRSLEWGDSMSSEVEAAARDLSRILAAELDGGTAPC